MITQISGEIPQVSVGQCFDSLVLNDMLDHSLIWYPIGKGASVSHLALVWSVLFVEGCSQLIMMHVSCSELVGVNGVWLS